MAETKAYNEVFYYLRDNQYPDDFTKDQKRLYVEKRKLRLGRWFFFVGKKNSQPKRWVHNTDEQEKILKACHYDKLAGHFGRDKTREKVCTKFIHAMMFV